MRAFQCVRSGHCCKVATCAVGVAHGAPPKDCTYLNGDKPGEYSCQLVTERPELYELMAMGTGCSSTMFNLSRQMVLKERQ